MLLPRNIDAIIKRALGKMGYTLYRNTSPHNYIARRMKIMDSYGIKTVLDVGANTGQYATALRSLGYQGNIVSFEPMRQSFLALRKSSMSDPLWECHELGLGDNEEELPINIAGNSISSSVLPMLEEHLFNAPRSRFIDTQKIKIKRLDDLDGWNKWKDSAPIWLKVDVQGYEDRVLQGAIKSLANITAIQIELSLKPLYEGQLTIRSMLNLLGDLSFDLVAFEPGFQDKSTGELLQVDGIFRNRNVAVAIS